MNHNKGQHGYSVDIEKFVYDAHHSFERFGEWSESCSHTFKRIYRREDKTYPDITSDLDLKKGDECWLVWVEWSSGDSFGRGYKNGAEAVALFDNALEAEAFAKWIPIVSVKDTDKWKQIYTTADGEEITVYVGTWSGYFENLEEVHVEHTVIGVGVE